MTAYRFGNTSLVFESTDEVWLSHLARRYPSFHDARPVNVFEVRYQCSGRSPRAPLTSPLSTYPEAPVITATDRGFTADTATTSAEVDLVERRALLRGPRALYPLDNLLRHLLPALGEQGAVFHAAALARNGQGVLACGPSGAGKSTLASLAGENAMCDELAAVRSTDGGYRLTSLPFWKARPGSVALTAVLLLRHGRDHDLLPLSPADALRRLARQLLWPVDLPRAMDRALGQLSQLVGEVPVLDLVFSPRPDAWSFIQEQVLV